MDLLALWGYGSWREDVISNSHLLEIGTNLKDLFWNVARLRLYTKQIKHIACVGHLTGVKGVEEMVSLPIIDKFVQ